MKKFGHYEVTAELGRGGMGVVYKGWEPSLNRQVAIKVLGDHLLNDKDLVERFTREAKATAALNHPNVIQIYYIGKEGNQPYFAMEYIEGESLDDILKGGNSLPVKNAKNILKQACKGLAAAHKLDLVHRDIKPANLMLTKDGTLKVVDFGIARTREYGDKLTNTGEFVGTPGYLSPEVCIGKEVDQRSDIFSLGIVFYEMLAGKVPFENDSPLGLMLEVVQSEIPDIRELNKKVDKKTSYILNKMIAKSPDDRYQSCKEIDQELGNTIDNETIPNIKSKATVVAQSVKPRVSDQITLPGSDAITAPNLTPVPQAKSGKKWLAAALLFSIVGAASFGYYNGYLPIPHSTTTNNATQSLALIDSSNDPKDDYSDIPSDKVNVEHSAIEGKGIMAGLDSMFGDDDNQDEAKIIDNTEIDFPENTHEVAIENKIQQPTNTEIQTNAQDQLAHIPTDKTRMEPNNFQPVDNNHTMTENSKQNPSQVVDQNKVTLPAQISNKIIAHTIDTKESIVAETKATVPPVFIESTQHVASGVQKQITQQSKPPAIPRNKGVVVIAFGDPAIANPVEKTLESQLKQKNIKVMNEQFIPGMRQLINNGLDLAELKHLIQKNGGQAMVIANVNYVGSQQLNYAGRSSELINAQLDIDTYDIVTGDSIGSGFGSKLSYTSLNATDEATDAVMQYSNQLTTSLKGKM